MLPRYTNVVKLIFAVSLCGVATTGCASKPPAPVVAAAAEPAKKATPTTARAKPKADCHLAQVNLPADRKLALFEQFAAEEGAPAPARPHHVPTACAVAPR